MHLTRNSLLLLSLGAVALTGCDSCKSKPKSGPVPEVSATPSAAESTTLAPPAPPIRQLTDREPLDGKALAAGRAEALKALDAARAAQGEEAKKALSALLALRNADLTGGYLALETSKLALRAGELDQAVTSARHATRYAAGNAKLFKAAEEALSAATRKKGSADAVRPVASLGGVPAVAATTMEPVPSFSAACDALVKKVQGGGVPLLAVPGGADLPVSCEQDYGLQLGSAELRRAVALRLDVALKAPEGALERVMWVALETGKGVVVWGPVAQVVAPKGVVNDVVVDLQQVDVLPGQSPEVVVKVMERRTEPDVALNEVAKVDHAWVVLLTTDRGKVEVSKQFVLDSRVVREALDASDNKYPAGALRAAGLGKPADYAMKVAWTGANSITLTKGSGNTEPFAEGEIRLFSE